MSGNFYAIIFDRSSDVDFKEVHQFFKRNSAIKSWWHYIRSCYLVRSELDAEEITDALPDDLKESGVLVVRIDLDDYNGWLKEEAWNWFRRQIQDEIL